jgi:hypothetical protein
MSNVVDSIDIEGVNKADILVALYNSSKVQGMGFLQATGVPMKKEEAELLLNDSDNPQMYFDYLHGKIMKVRLDGDVLRTAMYDRDNGEGAAHEAIKHLLV